MSTSKIKINAFTACYGEKKALMDISVDIQKNNITAMIGPSGCGKTTLLRSINRLNDLVPSFKHDGEIVIDGRNIYIYKRKEDIRSLRRNIGMIFQKPNPLPMSVLSNVTFPYIENMRESKRLAVELAKEKLQVVGLFDELNGRLDQSAFSLSGGQQQRLCIARALMMETELMLFDEPCSALDPISTFKIEELLTNLKETHTIVMVTHNLEQASRIADDTLFFYGGKLIESAPTLELFMNPCEQLTKNYIRRAV
ncbi:MAG: phosphate ABC transporter ATP-binding protein [Eubacteriales bacterium]